MSPAPSSPLHARHGLVARTVGLFFPLNVVFLLKYAFFLQPGSGKQQMVFSKEVAGVGLGVASKRMYFYMGRMQNQEEMLKLSRVAVARGYHHPFA